MKRYWKRHLSTTMREMKIGLNITSAILMAFYLGLAIIPIVV
jgi:hypothetical protein